MIEFLIYTLIILLIATFSYYPVVLAGVLLVMNSYTNLLASNFLIIQILINILLPSISGLNIVASILVTMQKGSWTLMVIVILILLSIIMGYSYFLESSGQKILESRRFNKSLEAMKLVFGIILFFACFMLCNVAFSSNALISLIIFILSFIGMYKYKIPMILCVIVFSTLLLIVF